MNVEQQIKNLELISVMQKIEIEVFKAKQATRRWGTPEGNPVAAIYLKSAEKLIGAYQWETELQDKADLMLENIVKYRKTLEVYDVTYGSMYKTEMDDAYKALEEVIYSRITK